MKKHNFIIMGIILGIINIFLKVILQKLMFIPVIILAFVLTIIGIVKKDKTKDKYNKKDKILWLSFIMVCLEYISWFSVTKDFNIYALLGNAFFTVISPSFILSCIIFIYYTVLYPVNKKQQKSKENLLIKKDRKQVLTTLLVICLSILISFIPNDYELMVFLLLIIIDIFLIIFIIVLAIKIKNEKSSKKYNKIFFRIIFTIILLINSMMLMSYSTVSKFIIAIIIPLLIVLWRKIDIKKGSLITIVLISLVLSSITINYFVIEPRINSLNYLNYKYGLAKDKLEIKNVEFECTSGALFVTRYRCTNITIKYGKYDIFVTKSDGVWYDEIYLNDDEIEFKNTKKYLRENKNY